MSFISNALAPLETKYPEVEFHYLNQSGVVSYEQHSFILDPLEEGGYGLGDLNTPEHYNPYDFISEDLESAIRLLEERLISVVYARVNVILLGGYSRSGKSTLLNDLPLDKFNPLSSSKVLHQTLLDVYKLIGIAPTYPPHQTKDLYVKIGEREYFKGRQLLIELAEEVIVKNFGRGAFALACVEKIDPKRINVIETFGGEEAKRLDKLIRAYHPFAQIKSINIRRTKEQPDADGRELLPNAAEIYANSFVDQTLAAFIQYAGML